MDFSHEGGEDYNDLNHDEFELAVSSDFYSIRLNYEWYYYDPYDVNVRLLKNLSSSDVFRSHGEL